MTNYGVVLVTADTQDTGNAIAEALIEKHLAACINLFPVHSIYTWQCSIQRDREWQLLIKTDLAKMSMIETVLEEIHPYEVPEIIAIPICQGAQPYLDWIAAQVGDTPT